MTLTKDDILTELQNIISDPSVSIKDKLTAIKLAGDHLGMFAKQVNIDIRKMVAELNVDQLEMMQGGRRIAGEITDGTPKPSKHRKHKTK